MNTATNKAFTITNHSTGANLGTYVATTPAGALDRMAREADYESYAACCADVPAPQGGLRVVESTEWFEYAQGYRRVTNGNVARVAPGLEGRWTWIVTHASGAVSKGTAREIPAAKAHADATMAA